MGLPKTKFQFWLISWGSQKTQSVRIHALGSQIHPLDVNSVHEIYAVKSLVRSQIKSVNLNHRFFTETTQQTMQNIFKAKVAQTAMSCTMSNGL